MTLSRDHDCVINSAHYLSEANIWPNFNENPSMGNRDMDTKFKAQTLDMERTPNARLKLVFSCDLESAWSS